METSEWYRRFAELEVRDHSPCYEAWSLGIASDADLLTLIDQLPDRKRQPNLLFGAARYLGATPSPFEQFKDFVFASWPEIREVVLTHSTQTNESGRCATLLPLFTRIAQHADTPIALIEFGASAGLCLYPDRYSYHYDAHPPLDPPDGSSPVLLPCTTSGNPPLPDHLPEVVYRAGVDLNPLDVTNLDHMRWLESLIWPEQRNRLDRLRTAAALARQDPPRLLTGDLLDTITDLVHAAPKDVPVIVFGSAVLNYIPRAHRTPFLEKLRNLPCHWITNEAPGVLPTDEPTSSAALAARSFITTLNGHPVAYSGHHGQTLHWIR